MGDTSVLGGEVGGPVDCFVASNAAVCRSPNEGHMSVGGFRLSCMWIRWTRGCEELTSWIDSEEGCERVRSDEEVLRMGRRG